MTPARSSPGHQGPGSIARAIFHRETTGRKTATSAPAKCARIAASLPSLPAVMRQITGASS